MELSEQLDIFLFLFVGTLGMFLLSGGVVGVFILYQKKLFKQQLLMCQMEATYKEELLHSNIEQVEAERKRISRDLHDEIGAYFSTLSLKLSQINAIHHSNVPAMKLVEESKQLIDSGIKSVRRISHDIIPPALELAGLVTALEVFCEQQRNSKLEVAFYSPELIAEPDSRQALAIYRIVQELFNNTIRHANATHVNVQLNYTADKLLLFYQDNGKGFNLDTTENRKGIGLRNISSRVSMIKASMHYETAFGKGVNIRIEIPYVATAIKRVVS